MFSITFQQSCQSLLKETYFLYLQFPQKLFRHHIRYSFQQFLCGFAMHKKNICTRICQFFQCLPFLFPNICSLFKYYSLIDISLKLISIQLENLAFIVLGNNFISLTIPVDSLNMNTFNFHFFYFPLVIFFFGTSSKPTIPIFFHRDLSSKFLNFSQPFFLAVFINVAINILFQSQVS